MGIMSFSANPVPEFQQFIKEHYKGGTVIDYGCGTGRYTEDFPADQYTGVDGFPENIEYCKKRWPDRKWILADLETWTPEKPYDYLISSVVMEQVQKLPHGWAKQYIMIEPQVSTCIHDYIKEYKPIINVPMNATHEGLRMMVVKEAV